MTAGKYTFRRGSLFEITCFSFLLQMESDMIVLILKTILLIVTQYQSKNFLHMQEAYYNLNIIFYPVLCKQYRFCFSFFEIKMRPI